MSQIPANPDADPRQTPRAIALAIFDVIDVHPWVALQLSRDPMPAVLRIWKAVGEQLHALGLENTALSDAGSALVNYVLGAAAQYVGSPQTQPDPSGRQSYLDTLCTDHVARPRHRGP